MSYIQIQSYNPWQPPRPGFGGRPVTKDDSRDIHSEGKYPLFQQLVARFNPQAGFTMKENVFGKNFFFETLFRETKN